jgi:NAD(P)-dependent dehydrogenase (short-subunit alcohol dehydrogenase family)
MKRVVLITGAAGGIGSATAEVFSKANWHVVGVDKKRTAELPEVSHFIQADISQPETPPRILAEISAKEGRLDALINNAAIQICKPFLETSLDEWNSTMDINVRAVLLLTQAVHTLLKRCGGAIVNVSSVHAVATSEGMSAYAASKGALSAMTRAMALELVEDDIRVNAVLPGAVDTKMLRAGLTRGQVEGNNAEYLLGELESKHAMGRVGRPGEIARAIWFLADNEQSSFITGQNLIVDGGATARLSTE